MQKLLLKWLVLIGIPPTNYKLSKSNFIIFVENHNLDFKVIGEGNIVSHVKVCMLNEIKPTYWIKQGLHIEWNKVCILNENENINKLYF